MEVTLHMFRHAENEPGVGPNPVRGPRISDKGVGQTIDVGTVLKHRIPDERGVEVRVETSFKARATGTGRAPYLRLKNSFRNAAFREPVERKVLDLPTVKDEDERARLFASMGRESYLTAWAEGKLPADRFETAKHFNRRIVANTLGRAAKISKAKGNKQHHLIVVTHDGGTKVVTGFGAAFQALTKLNPQEVSEHGTNYSGIMRNGEYIGVKYRNGKPVIAEFRGRWFAPGKKGQAWKEVT